jgi:hypothetical protein
MKKPLLMVVVIILCMALQACASKDPLQEGLEGAVDTLAQGCQKELSTYCKDVTPGEGRILSCLYAFADKLSPRCEYAVYDSINQLDRTLTNLSYAVSECRDDLRTYCAEIKPGEGRLLDCIKDNEAKVSSRCKQAMKDTGLKK